MIALAAVFYCYANTPFSLNYDDKIVLGKEQQFIVDHIVPYIRQNHANKNIYYSNASLAYFLDKDIYFNMQARFISTVKNKAYQVNRNEVIIWDNWFSPVEEGVTKEELLFNKNLRMDTSFIVPGKKSSAEYLIFVSANQ